LRRSQLRQLRSRIYISRILHPLGKEDTYRYVTFKLSAAKSQLRLPQSSLRLLWQACRGNIRLINLIMDRALHLLAVHDSRRLSPGVVRAAIQDIAEYQRGIKSSLKRARFRRVGLATAIVVLLLLGSFYTLNVLKIEPFHRLFQTHFVSRGNAGYAQVEQSGVVRREIRQVFMKANQTQNRTREPAAEQSLNRTSQVVDGNASSGPQNKENSTVASSSPDKAFTGFLKPYELTGLRDTLHEAIEHGNATLFRDRLPDSVGLIRLERLPEQKAIPFTALSWKDRTGKDPEWIALWRPLLRIEKKFPNRAEEEDILLLQKMLQELGFYNGPLDGVFGQETLRSVDAFQKAHALSRTHGPDPQTLFWICNAFELARKERG
ncbi:MAG: peptidoglycan-binding protein, partial [Desulfohalobiaceae bacterium]|nr:peptidoglycan-binding protein [Desulfohalobiaceae bacterium]